MLKNLLFFICFIVLQVSAFAQYISRSEPIPYNCPTICASGTITLKVPQIQSLQAGSQVQALLSNSLGSFASGTQVLAVAEYSSNAGTSWQNGPYIFSSNVNDLYIRVAIPAGTSPGSNYTIKIQASTGYVSNDLFQCSGTNFITVTPLTSTLPAIAENTYGIENWIGHVYSWTPIGIGIFNTPTLIANQSLFNTTNYQGHIIYNNLPFDVNFSSEGGVPGSWNNGTSMSCGSSLVQNFSIRMMRTENFAPGFYQFTIQGDDGIRFSVDGGLTWILDSFLEQEYSSSFKTSSTANPNGICLSGPTNLMIEYFQRPLDARMTFTSTLLSGGSTAQPLDLNLCSNQNGTMSIGNAIAGNTYQWQVSNNGGISFTNIINGGVYGGVNSSLLTFSSVTTALDGNLYQCLISGPCGQNVPSNSATLTVALNPQITTQPTDQVFCNGQTIGFTLAASGSDLMYQWQLSVDGGTTFNNVPAAPPYSFTTSENLTIIGPAANYVGYIYRCIISGCGAQVTSNQAEIISGANISISQQPIPVTVCQGQAANLTVSATGATSYQWQVDIGSGFINVNNGNGYSNAQTANLNLIGAATSVNGLVYRCVISGGCGGNVISETALITVNPNTAVTNQPNNQIICEGQNASFSFNANGSGLTYQWNLSTDGGVTFTALPNTEPYAGTTSGALNITNPSISFNGYQYQCVINGVCGNAQTTNLVTLTINSNPIVIQNPTDTTVCEGETISFNAEISGSPNYQWQISTDGGTSFNNLSNGNGYSGVNTATIILNPVVLGMNAAQFRLSGIACSTTITTSAATLIVRTLPSVSIIQIPPPICPGESISIIANTDSSNTLQWQVNSGNAWFDVINSSSYSGATTSQLIVQNAPVSLHNAVFRLAVEGSCGNPIYSSEVLVFIKGNPVIISSPDNQVLCSGGALNLPVVVLGEGISYQWQQYSDSGEYENLSENGSLSGTQTATLLLQTSSELNGLVIRCLVSGCGSDIPTDTLRLIIYQNDPIFIPNAFTPDTDPINDRFKLFTIGEPKIDAMVYDRWGELIYRWTTVEDGWDGTYLGHDAQEGIYVYRIKVTTACEQHTNTGTFQLIR